MKVLKEFINFIFSLAFIKQLIIAATIILSLILIFAILLRKITRHGEFVIVPDLVNSDYKLSTELLQNSNLNYKINFIYRPKIQPGTIVEQNPSAETKVKHGQTIYLVVTSRDIPDIKLPNIEGLSFYEAKNILKNENITVDSIEYAHDIEKNIVLKVKYNGNLARPGDMLPMFASVTLILGDGFGNSTIIIPDLTGLTLKEALFALRGYGLLLGKIVNSNPDDKLELEQLRIYKQYPEPNQGGNLNQGDKIDVYLK
ncbi:MAG: PASTA domain-containing protein [Solitalea-like symbiont of Tyrophagus putrescentiae]